jgi:hypothetical protein
VKAISSRISAGPARRTNGSQTIPIETGITPT